MKHFILTFTDGDSKRDFDSTFDAYVEILNAFNQCEEYFIGARLANEKEGYVNILDAEAYVQQVAPVKEYLELAAVAGFEDDQICEEIKNMYFMDVPEVLPSWKQYMEEYMEELENYMLKHPIV